MILAGVAVNIIFSEDGIVDQTKKARFTYTIRALEERANIQNTEKYFDQDKKKEDIIPNKGKLTQEEKDIITKNVPTLAESVYIATGETIYDRNMYWFDKDIAVTESPETEYLIDMDTLQVYQYNGTYFFKKMWHTLDVGVKKGGDSTGGDKVPDGYMRIHLSYPEESVDRQWRIGRPGESRTDGNLVWQDYTGEAILVKIDDIKNIWIRYNLKGVEVIQAPKGELAVDITATPTTPNQPKVTVKVYYDKDSTNQKVKIGNGGWRKYTGPFEITENCTIQAMAEKTVNVTDSNGTVIGTTKIKGKDSLTITNIGEAEKDDKLQPPTIVEISTISTEKARARIDYPTDVTDIKKVYKLNNGAEKEYTGEIAIEEWGTELKAYYYKDEKRSPEATKVFNDPTVLEVDIFVQPNPAIDESIKSTTVEIEYSEEAETKTYKIDNGQELNYTGAFKVTQDCTITAYARKTGVKDGIETETIKFKKPKEEQEQKITAPKIDAKQNGEYPNALVTIQYDAKAVTKQYSINGGELKDYTGSIKAVDGDVIYAINADEKNNTADVTYTVKIDKPTLSAPKIEQKDSEDKTYTTITITYDKNAVTKQYSVNGGALQNYTGSIKAVDGDTIYAINTDKYNQTADATYTVKIDKPTLSAPKIEQKDSEDKTYATITITYDKNAVTKQYSINGGTLQNYTSSIKAVDGDIIYAINADKFNQSADVTYTVKIEKDKISPPTFNKVDSEDKTYATVTITYDKNAVTKQYSVNGGNLQDYTGSIKAVDGDEIYAVNTDKFNQSANATYKVEIEKVELKAPTFNQENDKDKGTATITITYDENAVTKQYSINGGTLQNYTGPIQAVNEDVIYAINSDSKGNSKDATYTVEGIVKNLKVTINATPTTADADKVTVTINYDAEAETKTYTINGGEEKNYTGAFEITENSTIVAEAKAEDAYGKDVKQITNLAKGLAAPVITETKTTEVAGDIANITIKYDKKSVSNTYTINNEASKKYKSGFQIRENDTVITAYSVDKNGNTAVSQYVVKDLVRFLLIEKEKYYWITLPYPEQAINKEYKYKENGEWKAYKEDGFILVKPEYESDLIKSGKPIKLEVETGRYVDFDGHWYILDGDVKKLQEDIYMRWDEPEDSTAPKIPLQIIAMPEPPETTDSVDVFIVYPPTAKVKQYKIDNGAYQDYTSQLSITKNNTTITAKTQYSDGSWSEEVSYTITNIDENVAPEGIIDITAVPTEWTAGNVTVTITYNPNSDVLKKKYKVGNGSWQYVEDNTVTLTISQNNTIIYAALENNLGESSDAETYNVGNIDKVNPTATATSLTAMVIEDEYDITIQLTDTDSGINLSKCRWNFDQTSSQIGTEESKYTNTFTSETEKVKLTATVVGNWYLHILATDNVGHTVEIIKGPIIANLPWITDSKLTSNDRITNQSKTVIAQDQKGNQVVIPGGFKIAADSGTTVQQGIVIEDKDENQFVWVPVSNINADGSNKIVKDDESEVEITLGRYTFATSSPGTPTLIQKGSEYAETTVAKATAGTLDTKYGVAQGNYYYYELSDSRTSNEKADTTGTNTTAKNLQAFIEKTNTNKGFYIARYEASYGSGYNSSGSTTAKKYGNAKPLSKVSTANASNMNYVEGKLWNNISQPQAAIVSQNMYKNDSYVESDLVNSYAWDTAIVYIQAMGNSNYANANRGTNTSLMNTGATGEQKCKIFDMAGNTLEWTTEYSTRASSSLAYPCSCRGGFYDNSGYGTSYRDCSYATRRGGYISFRPLLYVKQLLNTGSLNQ